MQVKRIKKLIIRLLISVIALSVFVTLIPMLAKIKNQQTDNHMNIVAASDADGTFSRGSGTSEDPYIITTKEQLNCLASNVNSGAWSMPGYMKYWKLGNDIDYGYNSYTPIGYYQEFYGSLDGGGYTISNVTINLTQWVSASATVGVGIVGKLCGHTASVKNLHVSDITVNLAEGTSVKFLTLDVGGVVGCAVGGPTIENCLVDYFWWNINGELTASTGFGGVVAIGGYESGYPLKIRNCKVSTAMFTFNEKGSLKGNLYSAGICYAYATITDCYAKWTGFGSVADTSYVTEEYDISSPYGSISNCFTGSANSFPFSSVSSEVGTSGSTWYYNSDYENEPCLRIFMTWSEVLFTKNIDGGSVSPQNITIPGSGKWISDNLLTERTLDFYGTKVTAQESDGCTFQKWVRISNREYQAQFEEFVYTINYSDAYTHSNPTSYTASQTIALAQPTRTGYTFTGWSGTGLIGSSNMSVTITKGSTGNRSYAANWTLTQYAITYNLGDGVLPSGKTNPSSYNLKTSTFTLNNPTKTGYTFVGWSGTGLSNTTTTVTISQGSTGDREYTANWKLDSYTITYNLDDGIASNPTSYAVTTATFTLNNPTKEGYTFLGWSGTGLSGATQTVTINKGSTGDREYTANWERTKITLTFKVQSTANMYVNNVLQTSDYTVVAYYGEQITTQFDGANNSYSYTIKSIDGANITITYKPRKSDYWVSKFNIPKDNGTSSRNKPSWSLNNEDIGGTILTITPTIELKVYDGNLA